MGASALYRLTNHLNANQSIYKSLHDVNMCPVSHKMRQVDIERSKALEKMVAECPEVLA